MLVQVDDKLSPVICAWVMFYVVPFIVYMAYVDLNRIPAYAIVSMQCVHKYLPIPPLVHKCLLVVYSTSYVLYLISYGAVLHLYPSCSVADIWGTKSECASTNQCHDSRTHAIMIIVMLFYKLLS